MEKEMLRVIDREMLDRAGLTPEQVGLVREYIGHNVGNAFCAVLGYCGQSELIEAETLREAASAARTRYNEIMEDLIERESGVHRGGSASGEKQSKHQGMIPLLECLTTGNTGSHGEKKKKKKRLR